MEDEILEIEIGLMKRGKVDIIRMAAKLKTYRELLLMIYVNEVANKGMKRLEDLETEFKLSIWELTKKESAGLNREQCVELGKIVYLISTKI